jgi:drug/metabolite transporter (DMT)-like permease
VVTFPLYYRLIREIGAGRAAYHNVLVVIVAMLLSTLLEGYRWSVLAIAGQRAGAARAGHRAEGEVGLTIARRPSR